MRSTHYNDRAPQMSEQQFDGICVGGPENGRRWRMTNRQFHAPVRRETVAQAFDGRDQIYASVKDAFVIYEWRSLFGVHFWAPLNARNEQIVSDLVSSYRPIFPSAY